VGNSCFWLSEHFNIVCQTTVLYNLFHNSNDVCEVSHKDSSYNLVLIQYKRLLNVIYDTKTNISLTLIYLWHKNKHLPHILLRNIPCNSHLRWKSICAYKLSDYIYKSIWTIIITLSNCCNDMQVLVWLYTTMTFSFRNSHLQCKRSCLYKL
jgi:hypothetical protein